MNHTMVFSSSYKWAFLPVSLVIIVMFMVYSLPQQNIFKNIDDRAKTGMVNIDKSKAQTISEKVKSKSNENNKSKYVTRNEGIRSVFQASLTTIKTACEKYKSQNTTQKYKLPDLKNFSLEPRHKLVICRTAKHGSTSWARNLVQIYQQ